MTSNSEILKAYRNLMRHFGRLPSARGRQSAFREHARQQFRAPAGEMDIQRRLRMTTSYVQMVNAVNEASFLRSLDTGDKLTPQEIVRNTAAKVGFALPLEYDPERDQ